MKKNDGSPGGNCPICHKPPKGKEWYVATFSYRCCGYPWIPNSHKWCQLRRFPKDVFWILVSMTLGSLHGLLDKIEERWG